MDETEIKPMKFFAFGLKGPNGPEDSSRVGKFIAKLKSNNSEGNEEHKHLNVVPCSESHFIFDKD